MIIHENLFQLKRVKVVCKFLTKIIKENRFLETSN